MLDGPPDLWRRCDDDAIPPPEIQALLTAAWLEGEPYVYDGEWYKPCWRVRL